MSTQYKVLNRSDITQENSAGENDLNKSTSESYNLLSGLFLTDSQKFSLAVFALPVIVMIVFSVVAYMFEYAVAMALEMFAGVPSLFVMPAFVAVDIVAVVAVFNSIKKKFM